jgi:tight adherence protein C
MSDAISFPPQLLAASDGFLFAVQVTASSLMGVAVFVLSRTIRNTLHSQEGTQDDQWRYDVTRINELRRLSALYRVFQPVIHLLARLNQRAFADQLPEVRRELQAAGLPRSWTPAEYIGRMELIAILLTPIYIYFCLDMMGSAGIVLALVGTVLTTWFLRRRLALQARYRLMQIKRRMPFLLDLLTLLMEAGSTFLTALQEAVDEFKDHPVGVEFGRVLAEMSMGKNRTSALESLRDRLDDDEITGIVGAIIQGEELGTPLARLFRTQADVLRIKRTQRAETVAGEAGVKMLLPAILVMAATVLIILGPFVLSFIYTEFMS